VNLEVSNNEPVTKKESSKESSIDSKLSKATLYDFQRQCVILMILNVI
jgi:hypothetical protein